VAKFEFKAEAQGDKHVVSISGVIDEDTDFNLIQIAGKPKIDLKLGALKSINSCGIREWIKWMSTAASSQITWFECPKVIVDQINMVDGFLPSQAKVESFYVPYYNEDAGSEKNVLFRLGTEFSEGLVKLPAQVQDQDGNPMEMDVVESKYFKFIKK
jgi:hypothetical protein